MFGTTPAHGLILRHAAGIEISDFKIMVDTSDARPCFLLEDVEHADFFNIKPSKAPDSATFVLNDVKDFSVAKSKGVADTQVAETKHREI
jgi:hypothetical protein